MTGPGPTNSLRGYIVLSLAWLGIAGMVFFLARRTAPPPLQILPPASVTPAGGPTLPAASPTLPPPAPTPPAPAVLRIDVAGAVRTPGVYRLPSGSIVADAIAAAGGGAPDAALDRLNKAAALQDGVQVYVPRLAEVTVPTPLMPQPPPAPPAPTGQPGARPAGAAGSPLDINRAAAEELDTLPGIGPALAARIIAGRPYSKVEDLLNVPGIGEATLAKLRPFVTVK